MKKVIAAQKIVDQFFFNEDFKSLNKQIIGELEKNH